MKGFIKEFKEFALKGNAINLAIGVVIGGAFTAIVNSIVNDLINPLMGILVKVNFSELSAEVNGAVFTYGNLIMAIINFVFVAIVLFFVVKAMNKLNDITKKPEPEAEPTEKECPYCKRMIPIGASKCPECTSDL